MIAGAWIRVLLVLGVFLVGLGRAAADWPPLRAHPQNPYILEFRGQPTLLRTYGPHYGWVFDSHLDYLPHFEIFKRDKMNLTRVWCLGYPAGKPVDFIQPWQRSTTAGTALDGLGKWDFSTWNEDYFTRIKAFAQAASDRGIVVEFTFFSAYYLDSEWQKGPFHPANNVQGYGPNNRYDCLRPVDANLFAAQKAAVRRIVRELNGFDNIFFEVQNEPVWNDPGVKDNEDVAFQNALLAEIRAEESTLPNRHLVAHNFPQKMNDMSPDFDVLNEHYPVPVAVPVTPVEGAEALLRDHYSRGRILSLDETSTTTELQTRLEAWMFFIGGGGIYDGLDYEEVVYNQSTPSGDNALGNAIRGAVRNSWNYMNQLHLVALRRNLAWVTGGIPTGARLQASAKPGQQYVAYLHHGQIAGGYVLHYQPIDVSNHSVSLRVELEAGTWRAVWTRPSDMAEIQVQEFTHAGGAITLNPVVYQADVALRIDRTGPEDTTPPPPPSGAGILANPDGSITVNWDPVTAFDLGGYHLYRSESPGVPMDSGHRIATLPAGTTEFLDTSTAFETTYYYAVTAVDQIGNESSPCNEVHITSLLPHPPLNVTPDGNGNFILSWTTSLPGWYLQESPDLAPGSWIYSTLIPVIVAGFYQVTVTPSDRVRFFRLIHQPPPPPELLLYLNGDGQMVLEWTTASQGWYLQESPDMLAASWSHSSRIPSVVGDRYQIVFPLTDQQRFFRMVRQAPPAPGPPVLQLLGDGSGGFLLVWPAPSTGWHLQESPDLTPGSWVNSTLTPVTNGDHFEIPITPAEPRRFYRLIRP